MALALAATACHHRDETVRTDRDAYLRQMEAWGPVQGATATALERILATEFVDDAAVLHELADARPRAETHIAVARAYEPRTPPIAEIHQAYVAAWDELVAAYAQVERGIRNADAADLAAGRRAFGSWRDAMMKTARDLRQLGEDLK